MNVSTRGNDYRRPILVLLCAFCLAPTPGDVGGCGEPPRLLDGDRFFERKQELDCSACRACGFTTETCTLACSEAPAQLDFPEGCFPLVHDGRVCLRALSYSSCDEYAAYVSDGSPVIPTECDFCPEEAEE